MRTILLILTVACTGGTSAPPAPPEAPADPPAAPSPPATPAPDVAAPSLQVGTLSFPDGQARFIPCGSETPATVASIPPDLQAVHLQTARSAETTVLAHVDASVRDGQTYIMGWRRLLQGGECGMILPQGAWWAKGNEPFWSLVSGPDGARLHTPENAAGTPLTLSGTQRDGSAKVHTLTAADGTVHSLRLEASPCVDSMADARYSHTAILSTGEARWSGCGMPLQ